MGQGKGREGDYSLINSQLGPQVTFDYYQSRLVFPHLASLHGSLIFRWGFVIVDHLST